MSNNFYVYVHRTADTGRIFYVGKGTKNRAWTKGSRNLHWRNIVNKNGYHVKLKKIKELLAITFLLQVLMK